MSLTLVPPLARITGAGVGIVVSPGLVTVTETSTGYKAEIEPPTGKTAKELVDALPGGAGGVLKDVLNAGDATLKVTEVCICVEPSDGSACPAGLPPLPPALLPPWPPAPATPPPSGTDPCPTLH